MSRKKNIKLHLFYCLCSLLLENLDELKPTKPRMIKLKDDLTAFCEELNNELNNTATVQKSTYFSNISNKINTILRKEFNENM